MKSLKVRTTRTDNEKMFNINGGDDEPASPTSQYINSSVLCISILTVFELEIPFNDTNPTKWVSDILLPINPRFSSVMVKDEQGNLKWRRVQVKLEDHVKFPVFPVGLELYDDHVKDYMEKLATDLLPQDRPLWEVHMIKYPTKNAAATIVVKINHSIGDGFSVMSAVFNCLPRSDDPSLPLTLPSEAKPKFQKRRAIGAISDALSTCINTARDFGWSLFMNSSMKDGVSPIRSGEYDIDSRPITISKITFSLAEIKKIKSEVQGTVNDVIAAIIFYGIQLYVQAADRGIIKPTRMTALVALNKRNTRTYHPLEYMTQSGSKAPWGNHFGLLPVPLPPCHCAEKVNPLEIIRETKQVIIAKRNSLRVYLSAQLIELIRKFKGIEATARYVSNMLRNTSMLITNMFGPMEQMQIAGHPCQNFYFFVGRCPQSLTACVLSYDGKMNVVFGAERDLIDSELLVSCMKKSFENIFDAAVGK